MERKALQLKHTAFEAAAGAESNNTNKDNKSGGAEEITPLSGKKDKLSNKAKREIAKKAESKEREAEYNEQSLDFAEGAQFAVSQSIADAKDLDIIIPNVSIFAHKKELSVIAELSIVHGRRYCLVGSSEGARSALVRLIASGQFSIPATDYFLMEQELMVDETPTVDAVLRADR